RCCHPESFVQLALSLLKAFCCTARRDRPRPSAPGPLANRTDACFIRVIGSELVQKYVGEVRPHGARAVRAGPLQEGLHRLFRRDRRHRRAPALRRWRGGDNEVQRTMLELINQLDAFSTPGARHQGADGTNRPDTLDPALVRPGRLDRKVEFSLPDMGGPHQHLPHPRARHVRGEGHSGYELLARLTPNSTGAEIRSVCTEAGIWPLRRTSSRPSTKVIKAYAKFSATPKEPQPAASLLHSQYQPAAFTVPACCIHSHSQYQPATFTVPACYIQLPACCIHKYQLLHSQYPACLTFTYSLLTFTVPALLHSQYQLLPFIYQSCYITVPTWATIPQYQLAAFTVTSLLHQQYSLAAFIVIHSTSLRIIVIHSTSLLHHSHSQYQPCYIHEYQPAAFHSTACCIHIPACCIQSYSLLHFIVISQYQPAYIFHQYNCYIPTSTSLLLHSTSCCIHRVPACCIIYQPAAFTVPACCIHSTSLLHHSTRACAFTVPACCSQYQPATFPVRIHAPDLMTKGRLPGTPAPRTQTQASSSRPSPGACASRADCLGGGWPRGRPLPEPVQCVRSRENRAWPQERALPPGGDRAAQPAGSPAAGAENLAGSSQAIPLCPLPAWRRSVTASQKLLATVESRVRTTTGSLGGHHLVSSSACCSRPYTDPFSQRDLIRRSPLRPPQLYLGLPASRRQLLAAASSGPSAEASLFCCVQLGVETGAVPKPEHAPRENRVRRNPELPPPELPKPERRNRTADRNRKPPKPELPKPEPKPELPKPELRNRTDRSRQNRGTETEKTGLLLVPPKPPRSAGEDPFSSRRVLRRTPPRPSERRCWRRCGLAEPNALGAAKRAPAQRFAGLRRLLQRRLRQSAAPDGEVVVDVKVEFFAPLATTSFAAAQQRCRGRRRAAANAAGLPRRAAAPEAGCAGDAVPLRKVM
uniref:ATPase_AAA_core domain-containing protein n=1 Tax=Macrostomum lignano TaxID=282301 RepID=A0A1I8F7L9_9PLAT